MSYLGKSECQQCGREVDVSLNRAGMAYYRCAPCGVFVQQKNERGNRLMLAKTRRFDDPEDRQEAAETAEKPPVIPRESRESAASAPAVKAEPKPMAKPAERPAPKPAPKPSFLFNLGKP